MHKVKKYIRNTFQVNEIEPLRTLKIVLLEKVGGNVKDRPVLTSAMRRAS